MKYIKNDVKKQTIISELLDNNNVDAIILYDPKNRLWFTEFKSTEGYVLITKSDATLYVDGRYITAAKKYAQNVVSIKKFGDVFELINKDLKSKRIKKLGFESDCIPYSHYEWYKKSLNATIIPIDTKKIRTIKTNLEISLVQKACQISDIAFLNILKKIKPGMTELMVDAIIFDSYMREGADEPSFPSIVASGVRGAMPHGRASSKTINKGDMITIDFGCYYKGYASDITRTIALGEPDPKIVEIYNIIVEAQKKGISAIKPGVKTTEIDAICRSYIKSKGYDKFFIHSTGHGLGANVHEFPRVSQYCDVVLQPGMIITVEPGIYIAGLGGVRIEDDILVTDSGYTVLTKSPKEKLIKL